MPFEPVLLSYSGLACLALTTQRLRREVAFSAMPGIASGRLLAAVFLVLAAWRAVHHYGPHKGPVAWVGLLCLAGLPLVLILSRWPRAALLLAFPAAAVAALLPLAG